MIQSIYLCFVTVASPSCKKENLRDTIIDNTKACAVESITKLYDTEKHCAFTDLTKWSGNWYLSFRTSDNHAYTKDGSVVVLKSHDGKDWDKEVTYDVPGFDLRDPKFIITNDKLSIYTQGVQFNPDKSVKHQQGIVLEVNGDTISRVKPYTIDFSKKEFWPWRFSDFNGEAYAIGYNQDPKVLELVKTNDFKTISDVCDFSTIPQEPSEGTIRFMEKQCYILLRRSGYSLLGISDIDKICNVKWIELPLVGLGGPNFVFYDQNTLLISGRDYASRDYSYASSRTSLFVYKLNEGKTYRILTLPTGGDTAYPGLYLSDNELWISYHSTHEGSTKIYLAKVKLLLQSL